MSTRIQRLVVLVLGFLAINATATTHYVDVNSPGPVFPYTSWSTAATNVGDAALASGSGDTVLVTNGVYQYGGFSDGGSNRVFVPTKVTVQSASGPGLTTIVGYQVPGTTNGDNAVRCVFLNSGAILSGFTLTNGATEFYSYGGGVYCASTSCIVTNCIITGNAAPDGGGGVYSGSLVNCQLIGNTATGLSVGAGGGAYQSTLINCLLTENFASYIAGAAAYSTLINCTVISNVAAAYGGAVYGNNILNSIIYDNFAYYTTPDTGSGNFTNCCLFPAVTGGLNNITNAPLFANAAAGNFQLTLFSPCINAGNNSFVTVSNDLAGNPRIIGGTVDIGAYESPYNATNVHYVSLISPDPVPPFNGWNIAATNIQEAIDVANAGDFVVVTDGVYQIGGRAVYGTMTNRVVIDQALTVQSVNGPGATMIQGYRSIPAIRCAWLTNGAMLSGFTLTNGLASSSGDTFQAASGGGVWCSDASAIVSNCVLVGNVATYGGAAFQGTLVNCLLTNNDGGFGGAACSNLLINCALIKNGAVEQNLNSGGGAFSCTLSNCLLVGNICNGGRGGGGAYASTLTDCVLSNNFAGNGGGAALSFLSNSLISSNRASSAGGGSFSNTLANCALSYNSATYGGGACYGLVTDSILSANVGGSGGGACSNTLINCVLNYNRANYDGASFGACGGAAFNSALINCTAVSNSVFSAPGGAAGGGVYGGTLSNCIVYFNSTSEAGLNFYLSALSYCDTTPLPLGLGNITNDPALINFVGGDYHLQSNSPCINSGNNAYVTTATDLDGNPRIVGGTVDIGAYEYQTPSSVISYAYLQQYGLPTDGSVDYADLDGTTFNVYQDWIAGLNPTNSSSVLAMSTPPATNNTSGITVTWQSVSGIFYNVQRSCNLPVFITIQTNITGQAGTTSYTDLTATNSGPYYYRVGVQ